ncbi:MAG: gp58-like family protein, partial [Desulfuromonadales bacterium]|nr:gp58-like family protein [Desulfuromonadales bacterium]
MQKVMFRVCLVLGVLMLAASPVFAAQVDSADIQVADGVTGQDTTSGNGIKTAHIQDGAVTDAKISGVISGAKLGSHGHSGADLTDGTVTGAKIADGAVTDAKISGLISASKIDGAGLNADTLDGLDSADLAPVVHAHAQSDVTGLDTALAGKADADHNHDALYQGNYANVVVVAKSGGDFTSPI